MNKRVEKPTTGVRTIKRGRRQNPKSLDSKKPNKNKEEKAEKPQQVLSDANNNV